MASAMLNDGTIDNTLGTEITVFDGWNQYATGWYGAQEDNEVDYRASTGQGWDLEAMYLSGDTLSLVGGFNFASGFGGYRSGDIFIDINGDANVPADVSKPTSPQGYDYVLDMNWASMTYNVFDLSPTSEIEPVGPSIRQGANPFRYRSGSGTATLLPGGAGAGVADYEHVTSVGTLEGDSHYVLQVNLSDVTALWGILDTDGNGAVDGDIGFHFTIECGNDILNGKAPAVADGGATIVLLGVALMGVGALVRKIA